MFVDDESPIDDSLDDQPGELSEGEYSASEEVHVINRYLQEEPEELNGKLADEDYYPPLVFDRVRLECFQEVPLRLIAQAANTYFKVIKDLNPEIRGYHLHAGTYNLRVPEGSGKGFQARFKRLVKKHIASQRERTYVVERGDNLSLIAERFDVPLSALVIWNRLDVKRPIQPGDRLIVFSNALKSGENE